MTNIKEHYDVIVIGSGPAGQNAAVGAVECGAKVLIVEKQREMGGACVQYGTIPSKTLRETAVTLSAFRRRSGGVYEINQRADLQVSSLMTRLNDVVQAHQVTTQDRLEHCGIDRLHGCAEFLTANKVRIVGTRGQETVVEADYCIIATGSRPRTPPNIPVDHENILDSDSILAMTYLPQSLTVYGGGVIACEYASTFACLGVKVTMIDRYPSPMGFLDEEVLAGFLHRYQSNGGQFVGESQVAEVRWDGVSKVVTVLEDGRELTSDKALVAQGRVANTESLGLEAAGVKLTDRGLIPVNEFCQTAVPNVYGVGDVIGPPALASASLEQGRRAVYHALGHTIPHRQSVIPMGIYTIPEISSVGKTEAEVKQEHGDVLVGRVRLTDLARGQIMAASGGLLKLIADPSGEQILGCQIVGDGATELIHVGQVALASRLSIEDLAGTVFNFPTLAEAYRQAALDILAQRDAANATDKPELAVAGV